MVAMLLHSLNSLLSAAATWQESRGLLLLSLLLRALIWCITLAGAVVICIWGVEESNTLINELDEVM